jgi:peroxiredoxin
MMGLTFSGMAQRDEDKGYIVKVGDVAPDFEMNLLNGKKVNLSDLKGKLVMLQFTASWCGVCRSEMPFIEKEIWQEHKDKDFALYALDLDEPKEKAETLIAATRISYPVALDEGGRIFTKYARKESGVTRNVIVNKEGEIIFLTRLFNQEEFSEMKKVIEEELKK